VAGYDVVTDELQTEPFDLTIWEGKSWLIELQYCEPDGETPIPLTGYTVRGQIREYAGGPLCISFAATIIDADEARIWISLTPADTRKIVKGAVYDIELVSGDAVIGLLHGDVKMISEVTLP
jgi:hypothetical protein